MRRAASAALVCAGSLLLFRGEAGAQVRACAPAVERTGELGCWIVAHQPVGRLAGPQAFWHLDVFPTRAAAAEAAAEAPGAVVAEAFGRIWLFTVAEAGWRPRGGGGERVAAIGPLPVAAGVDHSAQYMEAVFDPGMTAPSHTHAGPEAWHTLSGETCLETPEGKQVGRAGGPPVVVPGGRPMHLTATGTERRRALVLILHEASSPPTTMVHDWAPKGLCGN